MPNLNYGDTQDIDSKIITMIKNKNQISAKEMSEQLGIGLRTIRRKIKENERIEYIGHGFSGHWRIKRHMKS